jgi:hypothetical protein
MENPLTELTGYFRDKIPLPDADLLRLVSAARTAGHRWAALASECEPGAEIEEPAGLPGTDAAGRLFRRVYDASQATRRGPLSWRCPVCRHSVTDLGPLGRPAHIELGHAAACARLARDQAADDEERRARISALITSSEPARGPLQRHHLGQRFADDCPRCGWRGFFGTHAATLNSDLTCLLCDNCYADLSPDITVSVTYFVCQHYGSHPFGVIRQRTRSDQDYPDLGQLIAWDMRWQRTPILVEEAHGGADCHVARTSKDGAELIIASLARRYWYGQALQVPWVRTAYPEAGPPPDLIAAPAPGRHPQV